MICLACYSNDMTRLGRVEAAFSMCGEDADIWSCNDCDFEYEVARP